MRDMGYDLERVRHETIPLFWFEQVPNSIPRHHFHDREAPDSQLYRCSPEFGLAEVRILPVNLVKDI